MKKCDGRSCTGRDDEVGCYEGALSRIERLVHFVERFLHLQRDILRRMSVIKKCDAKPTDLDRIARSPVDVEELSVRSTSSATWGKFRDQATNFNTVPFKTIQSYGAVSACSAADEEMRY